MDVLIKGMKMPEEGNEILTASELFTGIKGKKAVTERNGR